MIIKENGYFDRAVCDVCNNSILIPLARNEDCKRWLVENSWFHSDSVDGDIDLCYECGKAIQEYTRKLFIEYIDKNSLVEIDFEKITDSLQ